MKKSLFFLLVLGFIFSSNFSNAQTCTPNASCKALFCPDSLPEAIATHYYDETMTINVPKDTVIGAIPITIKEIKVKSITNYPPSLNYKLYNNDSIIKGGTSSCISLYGKPLASDVGTYKIKIAGEVWAAGMPPFFPDSKIADTTLSLTMVVHDSTWDLPAPCIPIKTCNKLVCTDSLTFSIATFPYNESISLLAPTTYLIDTAKNIYKTVDSVIIKSVTNYPPSLTKTYYKYTNKIKAGDTSCINLQGKPKKIEVGIYQITLELYIIFKDTTAQVHIIKKIPLTVHDSLFKYFGINDNDNRAIDLLQNKPNPFNQTTIIGFTSKSYDVIAFDVIDLTGKVVAQDLIEAKQGENYYIFNRMNLQSGIYFYRLASKENVSIKKMIIN